MTSNAPLIEEGSANAEHAEHARKRNLVPVASRGAAVSQYPLAIADQNRPPAAARLASQAPAAARLASQAPAAARLASQAPAAARLASQAPAAARLASQAPAAARLASQALPLPLPLPPAAARLASQALPLPAGQALRRAAACSGETGTPVPVRSPIRSRSARVATTPKVPGGAGAWLLSARDSRKTSPRKTQRKIQNPRAARRGVPTHHSSPAPHGGQSV